MFLGFISDSVKQAFILPDEKKKRFTTLRDSLIGMKLIPIKVHITPLTKFRPETPYGVKMLDAKYFQNRNCGFPII